MVIASEGYPGNPVINREIVGLEAAAGVEGSEVFHAATAARTVQFYTTGGRVLVVSARGENLQEARRIAYSAVGKIHIAGAHYRRDIGPERGEGSSCDRYAEQLLARTRTNRGIRTK